MSASRSYQECLIESLKKDPEEAAAYLAAVLEDGRLCRENGKRPVV
jgi:DNA-binding phage protein